MKKKKKSFSITKSDLLVVAAIIIIKTMFIDWFYIPSGSMLPTLQINDRVIVDMDAYRYRVPFTDTTIFEKGTPERGDVIIFNELTSGNIFIKRVMGISGDVVETFGHDVFINGEKVTSEKLSSAEGKSKYKQTVDGKSFIAQYETRYDGLTYLLSLQRMGELPALSQTEASYFKEYSKLREGQWTVPEGEVFVMGDNRDQSLDSRFSQVGMVPVELIRGKASFVLANMSPLKLGDKVIPYIPTTFTDFNRSIYEVETK